jgi:putative phage-type endonuclease
MKKNKKIPNINARDFATILNINPYQNVYQLLEDKIEKKYPFFGNKFTEHGLKYEKSAIKVYEKITGNKVDINQSNIKHPEYEWITGRVDGIVNYKSNKNIPNSKKRKRDIYESDYDNVKNLVVEIKCPLKDDRSIPLTEENVPKYYWSQCQVYMNMLDYDISHYVEYYIDPECNDDLSGSLHYITIKRDINWWNESLQKIILFREELEKYHNLGSLETHPVRIEENKWKNLFM